MIDTVIPPMLGSLCHDMILVCDKQSIIQEANPVAMHMLGQDIIGNQLFTLLSDNSIEKGKAFIKNSNRLDVGEISGTWELIFNTHALAHTPVKMRGGLFSQEKLLLVGSCEQQHLMGVYNEVLAINSELTNLIRQVSKEQARLTTRLTRLIEAQEEHNVK